MHNKKTLSAFPVILASLALYAGCTATPPTVDTSAKGDMTFDGLYPVKNTWADAAWARPDVDLSQYTKIMLQGVGVEYRPGGESGRSYMSRSQGGPFEVSEKQKAAFEQVMREAFIDELAKSEHFSLVDEPGPDVLLIRGALLDVVSYVPPETTGARDKIFLSRVGEATLVLELRDSITEAIMARGVDKRAAEDFSAMRESNRVNNRSEVRQLARTWGRLLRTGLEALAKPAQ